MVYIRLFWTHGSLEVGIQAILVLLDVFSKLVSMYPFVPSQLKRPIVSWRPESWQTSEFLRRSCLISPLFSICRCSGICTSSGEFHILLHMEDLTVISRPHCLFLTRLLRQLGTRVSFTLLLTSISLGMNLWNRHRPSFPEPESFRSLGLLLESHRF
jgi:hypothetical protein